MKGRYAHLAPLVTRFALGWVFMVHGAPKLIRTAAVGEMFAKFGLPMPYLMAFLVGLVELAGGFLLLLGVGTRIVAGLLALIMVGAIVTVKFAKGFTGGWEFDMILLAGAVSLMLSGSGSLKAA